MGQRITIDPVTRIEGHLKIDVEVENGVVVDAWSAGTMARGWEILLQNRDPRDAPYVCGRVCAVCEGVHTIAGVHALDSAFGADVPEAGRLMRNLFCSGYYMHDHYIHFYVLSALDYLDILAVADYQGKDEGLLAIKDKLVHLVQNNDTAPFTPRYEPDEFTVNDPETVLTLVSHYIKSIELKAKSQKMLATIAGIQPNPATFQVGGCVEAPSREELVEFRALWDEQVKFVNEVYIPDVVAVGTGPLWPLATSGFGAAAPNFLCYPMFPQDAAATELDRSLGGANHLVKGGVIKNGDIANPSEVNFDMITEDVTHSWYNYPAGTTALHPSDGVTDYNVHKDGAYSFLKSPRYDGLSMEVGPQSRGLVNQYPALMDAVGKGAQPGVIGRHLCRAVESSLIGEAGYTWIDRLSELATAGPIIGMNEVPVPKEGRGMGAWDAPRGALAHWIEIEDHRIKNYQLVVPSTWNACPRDASGQRGPYEEALIGTPVPDIDNPINVVRVVRSFDPCLACAVHLIDPETNTVKVCKI